MASGPCFAGRWPGCESRALLSIIKRRRIYQAGTARRGRLEPTSQFVRIFLAAPPAKGTVACLPWGPVEPGCADAFRCNSYCNLAASGPPDAAIKESNVWGGSLLDLIDARAALPTCYFLGG